MQKSILITGCSSGIGLRAAKILQKRGYRVFAAVRKQADLERLRSEGLESLILDVNDSASIRQGLEQVLQKTGGTLDALFNNCGYVQSGAVEDLSRHLMEAQFQTNVFGPMELTTQVIPIMRKQGYGRIVQNSSMLGVVTMPYLGAYNASKFALDGFSHTLRQELRGTKIYLSILAPGPIKSRLRENAKSYIIAAPIREKSHHQEAYKRLENYYSDSNKGGSYNHSLEPDTVVKDLISALEDRKPKTHYYVGAVAKAFALFRRFLPESTLDWIVAKLR